MTLLRKEVPNRAPNPVYLANDLRHRRKVALKVLRPEFAAVVRAEGFPT